MRMNKQQQLDLFAGLAEDSETDSDDDGETESRLPAKVFAADQHQELQASPAACDMYSSSLGGGSQLAADHDCCCSQGVTAPDDTHPETDGDSSTSDDESSSSSSSDESSDSDGDPDLPPPVQVAQTKVVVS